MKNCKTCGIDKEETEFFKKKFRWLEGSCKQCRRQRFLDKVAADPEAQKEKERLRSERRRKTEEWKGWRKDHQIRNRKEISQKALEYYYKTDVLQKQKIWKNQNRDKVNAYARAEKKKRPFKHAARVYVGTAIREGILTRPGKCSSCLKECKPEAHHEDYMKPIEVIWLCRSCHGREHRKHKDKTCHHL